MQTGISFATAHAQVLKVAASACGDAVAGSIGELCKGGDPMATIFNLASTCGAAMAAIYTRALTGSVVFDMSHKAAQGNVTSQGKLEACGSSCSTAQGAAQAFAQAAACGVAKATDNCIAATTHVKTRAFTHAFVKNTADSWGKACTSGTGMVTSGGATIAAAAAASIAKAMGLVAAQACANCPTCKCRKLDGLNLNDAGDFSTAAADVAAGRVGLAQSMATATTTFCTSNGTVEQAKSQARAVIATWSDLIIGAMGSVGGFAAASGNNSWACGSGSLTTELLVSLTQQQRQEFRSKSFFCIAWDKCSMNRSPQQWQPCHVIAEGVCRWLCSIQLHLHVGAVLTCSKHCGSEGARLLGHCLRLQPIHSDSPTYSLSRQTALLSHAQPPMHLAALT